MQQTNYRQEKSKSLGTDLAFEVNGEHVGRGIGEYVGQVTGKHVDQVTGGHTCCLSQW